MVPDLKPTTVYTPKTGAAKAHIIDTSLAEALRQLQVPTHADATTMRVQWLKDALTRPASSPGMSVKNQAGTVLTQGDAQVIGVGCVGGLGGKTFLASDSFKPCVPFVLFGARETWLAHASGSSLAERIVEDKATYAGADVIIIRRRVNAQSADSIYDVLKNHFRVILMDVESARQIGVVVSGTARSILAYAHERNETWDAGDTKGS